MSTERTPESGSNSNSSAHTVLEEKPKRKESQSTRFRRGQQIGRYRLSEFLGKGGFGEVWKAEDLELPREVAIKFPRADKHLPAHAFEAFEREKNKLVALSGLPGIISILDAGQHEGQTYIVTQLAEGRTLADRLRAGAVPRKVALELVARIAQSLHEVHEHDVLHRDIKPTNILLDKKGKPFLTDFGLALTEIERNTQPNRVTGSIPYMAPEQVDGRTPNASRRSDVYSLGVVLFELLTEQPPFATSELGEYKRRVQTEDAPLLRTFETTLPVELETICKRCLERHPADRYQTTEELAHDIEDYLFAVRSGKLNESRDDKPKRGNVSWTQYLVALVVLLAGLLGVGWLVRTNSNNDHFEPNGFKPDPTAVIGFTHGNLLMEMPKPVFWVSEEKSNVFGHNPIERRFTIDTIHESMFELGRSESDHFRYRARIRMSKKPLQFALYWGREHRERRGRGDREGASALMFRQKQGVYQVLVANLELDLFSKQVKRVTSVQRINSVAIANPKVVDLEIVVKKGQVQRITIDNRTVEGFEQDVAVYQRGGLGVYLHLGEATVSDCWYEDKEQPSRE